MKQINSTLIFFCFLLSFFSYLFFANNVNAESGGLGRIRQCGPNAEVEGLEFDPTQNGKDVQFVMSNPVCASFAVYSYGRTKISIAWMNYVCGSGSPVPRVKPTPFLDAIDLARASSRSVSNPACAKETLYATANYTTSIQLFGATYEIARHVFDKTSICGSEWVTPNKTTFLNNNPDYKKIVEERIISYVNNPDLQNRLNLDDRTYREWYYGGAEILDNPHNEDYCEDVVAQRNPDSDYSYPPQKYYLRGLETGNFNCKRYDILPGQNDPRDGSVIEKGSNRYNEFRKAYDCCKRRSQNYVCIKYGDTKKFCRADSTCEINDIYFQTKSQNNGSLICAETYSLCPYNFYIGGGSEKCDYFKDGVINPDSGHISYITVDDVKSGNCLNKSEIRNEDCTYNNKAGRCRNYCQFMKHCTKTNNPYKYRSSLTSPYYSEACINFIGDSRNRVGYGTGFLPVSGRHFSAPIAQCVKETLENVFQNRAGHTQCFMVSEVPNSRGECTGGEDYKKGEQVAQRSFFKRLQDNLRTTIRIVMTLAVAFYGVKILIGGAPLKRSDLMMHMAKFALVIFFATGEAWQNYFFDGIYNVSTTFSQMVFKLQAPSDITKRDGCQFGATSDENGNQVASQFSPYPPGKDYLAIWDTLDCKLARYMGFGPEVSVANIAKLILAGLMPGATIGIYFVVALFIFAFLLISAIIRAIHIFVASSIAIILMVYVSPLTITASFFTKTNGIFKNWLTHIISYSLQPMILFAYIAVFLSVLDRTLIGSATFYGDPPAKIISCSKYCVDSLGNKVDPNISPNCDRIGESFVKPKSDSFACMITIDSYANWPGLEIIGISIPFILGFFTEDIEKKILTIIRSTLIIYFLDKFMSEIPAISTQLLGGSKLPTPATMDAKAMFFKARGMLRDIQKRGARGGKNAASGLANSAINTAKLVGSSGNKGKSTKGSGSGGPQKGAATEHSGENNGGGNAPQAGNNGGGAGPEESEA